MKQQNMKKHLKHPEEYPNAWKYDAKVTMKRHGTISDQGTSPCLKLEILEKVMHRIKSNFPDDYISSACNVCAKFHFCLI